MLKMSLKTPLPFRLRAHQVRYLIIPVLSLVLVHLVTYQRLPHEPHYHFPTVGFLVILFVGLAVCETNRLNYLRLNKKISLTSEPVKRALRQIGSNLLLSSVVFLMLTILVNLFLSGTIPTVTRLLSYLFVIMLISFSETVTFLAWDFYKSSNKKRSIEIKPWFIKSGNGEVIVDDSEIGCFQSCEGIVTLYLNSGKKIITNYNSLKEIEDRFDVSTFFKINRQILMRPKAISKISKDQNRKLRIDFIKPIQQHLPQIYVSRYKNSDFKNWLKSN